MAINFPTSPTTNDIWTENDRSWKFNGTSWDGIAGSLDPAAGSITYDMVQDVTATDKILGRSTAGAGTVEEITCTSAGRALIDDADATAQRTTLGLEIGVNVQGYTAALAAVTGTNTGDEITATATTEGVVELATQEEVDAGTDTSRVVTPETLAAYSGLPDAFVPAAYAGEQSVTLPNGLIMKFGTIAISANTNDDVVFLSAFTTVVNAQASMETTSTNNQFAYIRSLTTTTLSLRNNGGANNTIHWCAVGY